MNGKGYFALAFKGNRRVVGFDVASAGELQFLRNVLKLFAERFPDDVVWMFHHDDATGDFGKLIPGVNERVFHLPYHRAREPWFERLDLYVTTEQFTVGPAGVYTLTLFHGQPSKGVSFLVPPYDALEVNDAFFLYGPLHRQALEEHLAIRGLTLPSHLSLFDIGYTKSDDLLSGWFSRDSYLKTLGLDTTKKTILYAPAFNEGASMRECGRSILDALCEMEDYNVLAKLPIDCLRPTSDLHATGGVDWFEAIGKLEQNHTNFRLVRNLEADPAMASSDVMITCVSSIGFEFLALGKPVIYFSTPRFFTEYLARLFPEIDTTSWASRTAVNGGQKFGLVVSRPDELPDAVAEVLAHSETYRQDKAKLLDYLLYNPGKATEVAVEQIDRLLRQGVRSQRPRETVRALLDLRTGHAPLRTMIKRTLRSLGVSNPKAIIKSLLNRSGYTIAKTGMGFIEAKSTIAAARAKGLSVCDYRESLEDHPRKRGRRNRIIARLEAAGVFNEISSVCEIGAGTGMYLEKVIELAHPETYEVYETDRDWVEFIESEYGHRSNTQVICHPADGYTLRSTASNSTDLVHAHGVFVYLPLIHTLRYLKECVRVCHPGGYIVFDCHLDSTFSSLAVAEEWLAGRHSFPVIIPNKLLEEFAAVNGLSSVASFSEIYGSGTVDYFVWRMAA